MLNHESIHMRLIHSIIIHEKPPSKSPRIRSSVLLTSIHVIFSWTQIGRFGFTDREIGSQIGRFFAAKNIQF